MNEPVIPNPQTAPAEPPLSPNAPPAEPQPAEPKGQQTAPQPAAPQKPQDKPKNDGFAAIRSEARKKGREQVLAELNHQAKKLGFKDHAEMIQFAADAKKAGVKPAAQQQARPANQGQQYKQKRDAKAQDELIEARRRAANAEKRRRETDRKYDALQGDMALRESAIRAGVKDVGYVLHLLKEEVAGKTFGENEMFDEVAWFTKLRDDRPYLFGIEKVPASTAPSHEEPKPKEPAEKPAHQNGKSAMEMTDAEFKAKMKELGVRDPSTVV